MQTRIYSRDLPSFIKHSGHLPGSDLFASLSRAELAGSGSRRASMSGRFTLGWMESENSETLEQEIRWDIIGLIWALCTYHQCSHGLPGPLVSVGHG